MGYGALNALSLPSSAISAEADTVTLAAEAVMRSAEDSQALFGSKTSAISEMTFLAIECAKPDWDGNGAFGIDPLAVQNAENFLLALPNNISIPEFAPDPDGSISLDWIKSPHRMFSLSIGASSRLAYAWLDGTDRGHAVARFNGFDVPERILHGIQTIMSLENAIVRST